jgi:AcrR family transcriptional regulator
MPRFLTDTAVTEFRERLCKAAERLFSERGVDNVTMRDLATEVGVSAMTPYRYFHDKNEILATVRASAFNHFADELDKALSVSSAALERSRAFGKTYIDVALKYPNTYKLMFDVNQPDEADYPLLVAAHQRTSALMTAHVRALVDTGFMTGDPEHIGMMVWAATHGAIFLELAGKIPPGTAQVIRIEMNKAMARGLRPNVDAD